MLVGKQAGAIDVMGDSVPVTAHSLKAMDSFFAIQGYDIYKNRVGFNYMPAIERLYAKNKAKEKILLKTSVFLDSKNSNQIHKFENGYITNFKLNNESLVLYFSGYEKAKVEKINTQLRQAFAKRSVWSIFSSNTAEANTISCDNRVFKADKVSAADEYSASRAFMQGCGTGVGLGVYNASLGIVVDLAKIVFNVGAAERDIMMMKYCGKPSEMDKLTCQVWTDKVFTFSERSFDQLAESYKQVFQIILQLAPTLKEKPPIEQWKIGCEVITTLLATFPAAALNKGASLARVSERIKEILAAMSAENKLKTFVQVKFEVENVTIFPQKIISSLEALKTNVTYSLRKEFGKLQEANRRSVDASFELSSYKNSLTEFQNLRTAIEAKQKPQLTKDTIQLVEEFSKLTPEASVLKITRLQAEAKLAAQEAMRVEALYRNELDKIKELIFSSKVPEVDKAPLKIWMASAYCALGNNLTNDLERTVVPAATSNKN